MVAFALPHPAVVVTSHLMLEDVLRLNENFSDDEAIMPVEPSTSADRSTLNDSLTPDTSTFEKTELPDKIPAPPLDLDLSHILSEHLDRLRVLLRKFKSMYYGSLGYINTAEHKIDLIPWSRPISCPPHRAEPRQQEI